MSGWRIQREARDARIEAGARLARGKIVEARDADAVCWRPSSGRATGFAWKATTRSRRICSAARCWRSISPR